MIQASDCRPLLSSTVWGTPINRDAAAEAAAAFANDLIEANDGKQIIQIEAGNLAAAIIEAIECLKLGYIEINFNRMPLTTQIIESVTTHLPVY